MGCGGANGEGDIDDEVDATIAGAAGTRFCDAAVTGSDLDWRVVDGPKKTGFITESRG
jgi:hypothetical protein